MSRALAGIIADDSEELTQSLGYSLSVVAITDLQLGTWIDASGIDLQCALSIPRGGSFAGETGGSAEDCVR